MSLTTSSTPKLGPQPAPAQLQVAVLAAQDVGLLLLRLGMAAMLWRYHVAHKLEHIDAELRVFPDPLGVGHAASFALALSAEGLCSALVAAGLAARLACLPIVFTMLMVLVLDKSGFEGSDVQSAWLYALPYAALALTGPGRWSLDARLEAVYVRMLERIASASGRRAQAQAP